MSVLVNLLAWLAAGYAIVVGLAYFFQDKLLFLSRIPSREIMITPDAAGLDYAPVTIQTGDGESLSAWFLPAESARGALLFLHGNAGNISHRLASLAIFNRLGLSVLILDYRGYGQSTGKTTEAGTYLDAEAAWRFLVETKKIPPERIVLFGRSLGGAVAAHLAAGPAGREGGPAAMMLESAFTSVPDIAADAYPFLPARLLARLSFATESYLKDVSCPVLVIHSRDDEIIPVAHGRRLYEAANQPKRFLELHGGHNEGFMESGALYTGGLDDFLTGVLGPYGAGKQPKKQKAGG